MRTRRIKGYAVPVIKFGFEFRRVFPDWKSARRFMRANGINSCRIVIA